MARAIWVLGKGVAEKAKCPVVCACSTRQQLRISHFGKGSWLIIVMPTFEYVQFRAGSRFRAPFLAEHKMLSCKFSNFEISQPEILDQQITQHMRRIVNHL